MSLAINYWKVKKHLKTGGVIFALRKAIRYSVFLLIKQKNRAKLKYSHNTLSKGKTQLICTESGVRIFYQNQELTNGAGLNVGFNSLGVWTDSAKANWSILQKLEDSFLIRVAFQYLPFQQVWMIKLKNENEIIWQITTQEQRPVAIEEFRVLCQLNPWYKTWINNYQQGDFSRLDNFWHDLCLGESFSPLVGVRFPIQGRLLPALVLEPQVNYRNFLPIVQKPPKEFASYFLGFRQRTPGYFFSGKISLIEEETVLDQKIERLRQEYFKAELKGETNCPTGQKKSRVLLANLPWKRGKFWGVRAGSRWPHIKIAQEKDYLPFPFFLAYAASLLQKHGIEVVVIDALAEQAPEEEFLLKVMAAQPDLLVAETSTPSLESDLAILQRLPQDLPKALCGPEPNIRHPEFLEKYGFIHFVLIGEYEFTLLKLAQALREKKNLPGIPGLIYRRGTEVIANSGETLLADLNSLPWPLREGLPMQRYNDSPGGMRLPSVQMLASRGCPYGCSFCVWPQLMYGGNSYRARKTKDVVDEMEYLTEKMGFKSIYFDDDTFNINRQWMLEFAAEIKRRRLRGKLSGVPWAIMARPDLMDEEILQHLKQAGLCAVKYGVESASAELLKGVGKDIDLKKTRQVVTFTKSLGIKTHLTFMFGFPGETRQSIRQTIELAIELDSDSVQFSILTPFAGTRYAGEHNQQDGKGSVSDKELIAAQRSAYFCWKKHRLKKRISLLARDNRFKRSVAAVKDRAGPTKIKKRSLEVIGVLDTKFAYSGPRCVQIDLTDDCNNNCIGCWCNSPLLGNNRKKDRHQLQFSAVKALISELKAMGTEELYFSGGGEPLMHPDFFAILTLAKQHRLRCFVNTNFTLLGAKEIQRLIELRLDYLTASVWAATADTYARTHPNKDDATFYQVQEMLNLLNSSKPNCAPQIKLYNVIFKLNYHELEQMVDFALQTKSEAVEFTVLDTIPQATDGLMLSQEQCRQVLEQCYRIKGRCNHFDCIDKLQLVNLTHFMRRISDAAAPSGQYDSQFIGTTPCYTGWLFARIMPDGNVNSCLKSHRFPVGNIYRQPFREIWNSPRQRQFRQKTLKLNLEDPFFSLIGNDANCKIGCHKSCDNISGNIRMHNRIAGLKFPERQLLMLAKETCKFVRKLR